MGNASASIDGKTYSLLTGLQRINCIIKYTIQYLLLYQQIHVYIYIYTGYTKKNSADSKVNEKFISRLTRAQRTPSAAATVQVSHALPAVRFSCLKRGRGASFQDGK